MKKSDSKTKASSFYTHINVIIKQHKFHSITERKNRYLIAKTMCMSTEQNMIVVIAEATTNAPREEGNDRVGGERQLGVVERRRRWRRKAR